MSGLINRNTLDPLPLRSSSVFATIKGVSARTTAILTYYNDNREEIDAMFLLPLNNTWHVVEFEMVAEGHYWYSEVMAVNEVEEEKDTTSTMSSYGDDLFNIFIGKVSPWVIIEIQVTVICELQMDFFTDGLKYTLPQTFSPEVVHDPAVAQMPKTSLSSAISTLDYKFEVEIHIESPTLLHSVESMSHPIHVDSLNPSSTCTKLRVTLPEEYERTNDNFELLVFLASPREPFILIEDANEPESMAFERGNPISSIMSNPTLMLSYSPQYSDAELEDHQFKSRDPVGEFIFMIDRSSVIDRSRISIVRETCKLFLKSLPKNCSFNIVGFGTFFESLFKNSRRYSDTTVQEALLYIENMQADMGGTALYEPIEFVLEQARSDQRMPRQIFLSLYGKVTNPEQILEVIKNNSCTRFFIFDMGSANTALLRGLSTLSNGHSFQVNRQQRMQQKVVACLSRALQPAIEDLAASWILPDAYEVIYTPEVLPSIYLGNRINLYALLSMKEGKDSITKSESNHSWRKEYLENEAKAQDRKTSNSLGNSVIVNTLRSVTKLFTESPTVSRQMNRQFQENTSLDMENEVFLAEVEAGEDPAGETTERQSYDHIQWWRKSRYRENEDSSIDSTGKRDAIDGEKLHVQYVDRLRKSSSDCADSVASVGSDGSQQSYGHSRSFPGNTTRLGSSKSIEGRSPGLTKHAIDQANEGFAFTYPEEPKPTTITQHSRKSSLPNQQTSVVNAREEQERPGSAATTSSKQTRRSAKRMTQVLHDKSMTTHYIDKTNSIEIFAILEDVIYEKRVKLREYSLLQEEMTKCTWQQTSSEKSVDETVAQRSDSGLGNRSSSEPRTSDLEDETAPPVNTCGLFSKSSSGYFDTDDSGNKDLLDYVSKRQKFAEGDGRNLRSMQGKSMSDNSQMKLFSRGKDTMKHTNSEPMDFLSNTEFSDSETDSKGDGKTPRRKGSKARALWSSLTDKLRNIANIVNEKSSSTRSKTKSNDDSISSDSEGVKHCSMAEDITSPKQDSSKRLVHQNVSSQETSEADNVPQVKTEASFRFNSSVSKFERSRTITSWKSYELSERDFEGGSDGSQKAIICLSGRIGRNYFERFIPFKLVFDEHNNSSDVTIHQLAAKSIIKDLESQFESEGSIAISSKDYLKNIISDVSKCTNVTSSFTSIVLNDESGKLRSAWSEKNLNLISGREPMMKWSMKGHFFSQKQQHSKHQYHKRSDKSPIDADPVIPKVIQTQFNVYNATDSFSPREMMSSSRMSRSSCSPSLPSRYMAIVNLSNTDGSWDYTEELARAIELTFEEINLHSPFALKGRRSRSGSWRASSHSLHRDHEELLSSVWMTIISLLWLHHNCHKYAEEWILVHRKAFAWLECQTFSEDVHLDEIIKQAERHLFVSRCPTVEREHCTNI